MVSHYSFSNALKGMLGASVLSSSLLFAPQAIAERITNVTPAINSQDASPNTSISGVFDNDSQGTVDAATVRIYLNERDITAASTITSNFFSYRPGRSLARGNYDVRIEYDTTQGLRRSVGWRFAVSPQMSAQIESVTHNANDPLQAGATLLATVTGTPRSQASVLLIENGRTLRSLSANEVSPGVYVASLTVDASRRVQEGIVVGRLERAGQTTFGIAETPVILQGGTASANSSDTTLNPTSTSTTATPTANPQTSTTTAASTAAPTKPRLTSPTLGERIDTSGFTLTGETSPGAMVRVRVVADTPLLGNVFSLGGERLVDLNVEADSQGMFEVRVPAPTILKRDTRYQVTMTASQNGQTTAPVEAEFKQR